MKTILKKASIYSILFFIIIAFNSCGATYEKYAKEEFTEKFKAIPPHFGEKNTVLLITLRDRSSYDDYLKEAAKLYKGEIVFINIGEEMLTEYADKTKYRFVFDYTNGSSSTVTQNKLSSTIILKRFFVKDRVEDRIYQSGYETQYFSKAMKAYMENLELKRISKNN